jgi:hypothetical protein
LAVFGAAIGSPGSVDALVGLRRLQAPSEQAQRAGAEESSDARIALCEKAFVLFY